MQSRRYVVLVVMLVVGLAGCGDKNRQPRRPPQQLTTEYLNAATATQDKILTAKIIQKADVESAANRMQQCLEKTGLDTKNEGWDPVTQQRVLISYRSRQVQEAPEHSIDAYEKCNSAHLEKIQDRYIKEHRPAMSVGLARYIGQCLREGGITLSRPVSTSKDLVRAVPADKENDLVSCVDKGISSLYPWITAYSFP